MTRLIPLGVLFLLCISCSSSKPKVDTLKNAAAQETVQTPAPEQPSPPATPAIKGPKVKTLLIGKESREALTLPPFDTWYTKNYKAYTVKEALTPALKKSLEGVEITTFMGTWCGDSKRETPRMFKILDTASFQEENFELITVDRSKKKPTEYTAGNDIIRVPTFIFTKDGKELGRIVERPVESLEADMIKILNGEPYKHSYEK